MKQNNVVELELYKARKQKKEVAFKMIIGRTWLKIILNLLNIILCLIKIMCYTVIFIIGILLIIRL